MIVLRKLPITLFEILIVMAILAVVSGALAIGIDKALVNQRFRNEVSMVVEELRRAQDLMMILGADVHVKFAETKERDAIPFWLEMETQLSESIQREVVNKVRHLKTIRSVTFEDSHKVKGKTDIKFFSKGAVMSKGLLKLSISGSDVPQKNVLETYICLPGYPRPIFNFDEKEIAERNCNEEKDNSFNDALTRDTLDRLPEKVKKPSAPVSEKGNEVQAPTNPPPGTPDKNGKSKVNS